MLETGVSPLEYTQFITILPCIQFCFYFQWFVTYFIPPVNTEITLWMSKVVFYHATLSPCTHCVYSAVGGLICRLLEEAEHNMSTHEFSACGWAICPPPWQWFENEWIKNSFTIYCDPWGLCIVIEAYLLSHCHKHWVPILWIGLRIYKMFGGLSLLKVLLKQAFLSLPVIIQSTRACNLHTP